MDALKQQLLKVQQQLAGLSASQKMLTASLLVIMVMTLFYWSRFASTSEMEPVIDKLLSPTEIADLKNALGNEGVKYEEADGKLLVPISKRPLVGKALSGMALNGKLPEAYTRADDTQSKGGNFLESQADRDQRLQETRRQRVEQIIRNWPNVTNVMVILTGEKRIGALSPDRPTASVAISHTGSGNEARKYVEAARMIVAHAQVGLRAEDVGITLNGQAYRPEDPDSGFASGSILENRKQAENSYAQNLRDVIGYIPDVRISVAIKLVTESSMTNERTYDPKNKVDGVVRSRTQSDTNTQKATGGEAGVVPNVGSPDSSSGAGTESTSEKAETESQVAFGYKDKTIKTPSGDAVPQGVAVNVPATYYRRVWKDNNPTAGREPTTDDLKPLIAEVEERIRGAARNVLTLADEKSISIGSYYPVLPDSAVGGAQNAALAAIPTGSGFGAKEIALGALAVISLFMVSMMVKKSAPQPVVITPPVVPDATEVPAEPTLLSVKELAGEVGEADLTMLGQELDDDQLETRQVIEQVGTMVKQNPDAAANLVKRWLNQE
ncbi:MAG: flagellar M-ring protein FliF C-terminal domain-containing protein [Tepidisphaeraceae bacterium]